MLKRHYSLASLQETVDALVLDGDLETALALIQAFVEETIADPFSIGRVFSAPVLDQLCSRIGARALSEMKLVTPVSSKGRFAYVATEFYMHGGHTLVAADLVRLMPSCEHFFLMTDVLSNPHRDAADLRLKSLGATVEVSPPGPRLERLKWVLSRLHELAPEKTFWLHHHQDAVAVAAAQESVAGEKYFIHHADHQLCLGIHTPHLLHVDLHNLGFFNCRDAIGVSSNLYWPLVCDDLGEREQASGPFESRTPLRTSSSGSANKFEGPYLHGYADVIAQVLRATSGHHVHIGQLSEEYVNRIRSRLVAEGVPPERFSYIPWVPSLWRALIEQEVDVYLGSWPIGGGRALIEAMGAGVPVVVHVNYVSRFHSGFDLAHEEAPTWRTPDELLGILAGMSPEKLASQSRLARSHYERHHAPSILASLLEGAANGKPDPIPLRQYRADALQTLLDQRNLLDAQQATHLDEMQRMQEAMIERDGQIGMHQRRADELDTQLKDAHRQLEEIRRQQEDAHRQLEDAHRQLQDAHRQQEVAHRQLEAARAQSATLEQVVAGHATRIADRDKHIAKLISSRSWRLTRPLRFAGRLVRGEFAIALAPFRRARGQLAAAGALCRAVPLAVSFYGGSVRVAVRRVLGVLKSEGVSGVVRRASLLMMKKAPDNRRDGREKVSDAAVDVEATAIRKSGLFDESYYRSMYADLEPAPVDVIKHYCELGWREGKNPSDDFDTQFYLATYSDIRNAGLNPFYHYVMAGASELRHAMPDLATRHEDDMWFGRLDADVKLIVFYKSPDWKAVRSARPRFKGHRHTLLPLEELGFYDPSDWRVLRRHAEMARRHGIHGFCFELSDDADGSGSFVQVENFLDHDEIDFCFCVYAKVPSEEGFDRLVALLVRAVSDRRCIHVANRPVIVVGLPDGERRGTYLLSHLRARLADHGVSSAFLIAQWEPSSEDGKGASIANLCDAVLDLPSAAIPGETGDFSPIDKNGVDVVPYAFVASKGVARVRDGQGAAWSVYHTVTLGRDNTAKLPDRPLVYSRFHLKDYRRWLDAAIAMARVEYPEERRFVFVNAWNGWDDGLVLEPDREGGFARINETARALLNITSGTPMPKVSVIVPNYNHERFLPRRLDSIYGQTYKNIEVILLDDGSSDQSRSIMDRYAAAHPDITRTLYNDKNSGSAFRQWAKGIKAATGDLVWIAESDDYCDERFLEILVRCFDDEAVLLAYSRCAFVDRDERPIRDDFEDYLSDLACAGKWKSSYVESAHNEVRMALGIKNTIPNASGVLFKRPIDMALLDDESWLSMAIAGDWVFYLHVIRGGRIAYNCEATNFFRRYEGSAAELTYKRSVYFREVGMASRTVAALYAVPLAVLEQCRRGYSAVYKNKVGGSDEEFERWYDYQSILQLRESRLPNVMVSTMGFFPGGAEILPIRLANEFKRQGLSVLLLNAGLNPREDGIRRMLRNDVPVVETSSVDDMKSIIHEFGVEVLNTHQWHIQKYPLQVPDVFDELHSHIASLHGMIEHGNAFGVTTSQLQKADRGVTTWVYTAEKNLMPFSNAGLYDKSSRRFVKIPNGMQPPQIVPIPRADMGIPQDAFVLCCVSRAIPDKGWAETILVVKHARMLSGLDIRLILAGNGPVYDEYCRSGAPDFVYLAGFTENSVGHYAAADMGIMLTKFKSESFPLTILDCLFAGRPYIASDVGDIRNMLTTVDGIAGEVISLENWEIPIERAAEVVAAFAVDKRKYLEAAALVQDAAHRYRIDIVASEYVRLFKGTRPREVQFGQRGGAHAHATADAGRLSA